MNKIRLGNKGDGGYVIADVPNYDCYISAGIGSDESFSNDVIRYFNIDHANAFDGTIKQLPNNCPEVMNIYNLNIGPYKTKNTANLKIY
jgi:hypothetical protein